MFIRAFVAGKINSCHQGTVTLDSVKKILRVTLCLWDFVAKKYSFMYSCPANSTWYLHHAEAKFFQKFIDSSL